MYTRNLQIYWDPITQKYEITEETQHKIVALTIFLKLFHLLLSIYQTQQRQQCYCMPITSAAVCVLPLRCREGIHIRLHYDHTRTAEIATPYANIQVITN